MLNHFHKDEKNQAIYYVGPDFYESSSVSQWHKHCATQVLLFNQGSLVSVPVPARLSLNTSKLLH